VFIPLVEGTHLSGMLTYWVLETVSTELGDWLRDHRELHIGVNVPPEILGRGGLEYTALKAGVSDIRNQIILEVTERGIPDNLGLAALEAASRSGVRIALDDVTLSSTNLVILSRCKLDLIKLDRSLVDHASKPLLHGSQVCRRCSSQRESSSPRGRTEQAKALKRRERISLAHLSRQTEGALHSSAGS
jgi:sensor c-di-GMP phosphodiesterase-like protein